MMHEYRRKLIEVALPLDAINKESAREKSIRHGHPSTLHLWWARRPLAACRAVLFAQMVDDPSSLPDEFPTGEAQEAERLRLFGIIEELVKWDNTTNEAVLHAARTEIARSAARNHGVALPHQMTPDEVADALKRYAPPVLDPFAGGGSIPLEAQRLGLEAHASDLNPVAVLICKALIEIPAKFAGRPPVNPEAREKYLTREWKGAQGLAEDVRYYGRWMRDEAYRRIGHLYPKVRLPKEQGGGQATVIAWLWARTVKCPNPACGAQMPLVRSFALSTKKGKKAWVEPQVDRATTPPNISFEVRYGPGAPEGSVNRTGAHCIACGTSVPFDHVRAEGKAGRMGAQMMAIAAEGKGGRVYLPPSEEQAAVAHSAIPTWKPDASLPHNPRDFKTPNYGMRAFADLFTSRQLVALATFSDLVSEVRERVLADTDGNAAYADAVMTYLAFGLSKAASRNCTLAIWESGMDRLAGALGRQALPMTWDYAETNPLAGAGGDIYGTVESVCEVVDRLGDGLEGYVQQMDATSDRLESAMCISTDPPYYDNIGYADLSDFFYVWLRRTLGDIYPTLFGTLLVPKAAELVATPYRFGGSKSAAETFFREGLGRAFQTMRSAQRAEYPLTVFYAFKQAETGEAEGSTDDRLTASTGWETMLEGLIEAKYLVDGTWPVRSELTAALKKSMGALASSIVLVCRPRPETADRTDRRGFLNALHRELPHALRDLQRGLIAPVDLQQAAIGPGMAVFSRYSKVLESDGTPMRVRTALQLINQALDEVLAEQEGEYDADTRWAVAWFEQYGMQEGPYGVAETLSKAKNTSVEAMRQAGIVTGPGGKVRLVGRDELSAYWNPAAAKRLTIWEVTQRLIRALEAEGEQGAAAILDAVPGGYGETARDLAYRLYTVCERKKRADEARAYNSLVVEWSGIAGEAERLEKTTTKQSTMFS